MTQDLVKHVELKMVGRFIKWPFRTMLIGDQISIEVDEIPDIGAAEIARRAHAYGLNTTKAFKCKTSEDGEFVIVERLPNPFRGEDGRYRKVKERPEKTRKTIKWPFRDMKVGDIVKIDLKGRITLKGAMGAAHNQRDGSKFRCRQSMDKKQVIVWRIK